MQDIKPLTGIKPRLNVMGLPMRRLRDKLRKRPTKLLHSNQKLQPSHIIQWSLPAAESLIVNGDSTFSRVVTCPGAGDCLKSCYAQQGGYLFSTAHVAHTRNLHYVRNHPKEWVAQMIAEIKKRKVLKAVRLHDSGDFYSLGYLDLCLDVIEACPDVSFYAYTKMIPLFLKRELPANFTVVFSYGGKYDHLIDPKIHRHSRVFGSKRAMKRAGYSDTTVKDDHAADSTKLKIGLVYHGWDKYKVTLGA